MTTKKQNVTTAVMTVEGMQAPLFVTHRDKGDGKDRYILGGRVVVGNKTYQINGHLTEIVKKE